MIYSTKGDVVEIKNNALQLFNVESLFQKEFRLKTMDHWDWTLFQEKLGIKTEYGLVLGQAFSGKSTIADYCAKNLDMCVVDLKAINEACKKDLGTEEEPFEGELAPIA